MTGERATFSQLAATLDYPLFVVTATDGRLRDGCMIGFATQCSIHPPRFLACLSRENRTFRIACDARALAVHVLPRTELALAKLFGGETGDEIDKLERCDWSAGPHGLPILAGCPTWFAGEIRARHDLGDHVGFVLDPIETHLGPAVETVFFQDVKDRIVPGHPAS
ncbi:MAG TPA: flavin reductase family protein [Solirubrobacteraceae bacterium]|jgi:flavin reductase (DIM6/NTAB) family NADH-FMN oxidoreductase RutF|nr:flavin reductase family protein [Solirubrobacteraceae bacterium]